MTLGQASWRLAVILLAVILLAATGARAQETPPRDTSPSATTAAGDDLSVEQARLADRFERLEEILSQLAELSAATDPNRAHLLREAISQSREQDIHVRFESIVQLLEEERLSAAAKNQTDLHDELDALLTLLLKADRDKELESERDRVRQYLKEVARIIRMQKGVRARTKSGDDARGLAEDQQHVADDTGKLGGTIEDKERKAAGGDATSPPTDKSSKPAEDQKPGDPQKSSESGEQSKSGDPSRPSDSPPSDSGKSPPSPDQPGQPAQGGQSGQSQPIPPQEPTERATERLRAAQQRMDEARQQLDKTEREAATKSQQQALAELERAKAELERVLRQLREEEMERMLTQLVARFRKMLELQNVVYEGTLALDHVPPADRDHEDEIKSAGLSRKEADIVHEAEKALVLLHEEGSSVAFPEAIEQMRDDMQQVTDLLAKVKVDDVTQGLEEDIIAQLEETIAALEKARQDLEKNSPPMRQASQPGEPAEPPLVHKLAELKLIRSLQMRINRRTQRYGTMIAGEQAENAELLEALHDLAKRQERVYKATYDLSQGRND